MFSHPIVRIYLSNLLYIGGIILGQVIYNTYYFNDKVLNVNFVCPSFNAGTCLRGTVWTWVYCQLRRPLQQRLLPRPRRPKTTAATEVCWTQDFRSRHPLYLGPMCQCSHLWWTCRPRRRYCLWSGLRSSTPSWAARPAAAPSVLALPLRRRPTHCTLSISARRRRPRRPNRIHSTFRHLRARVKNHAKVIRLQQVNGRAPQPRPDRLPKRSSTYRHLVWRCKSLGKRSRWLAMVLVATISG